MNTTIEKLAKRNFVTLTIAIIIAVALLAYSILLCLTDVINLLFPPFKFDLNKAIADKPLISLSMRYSDTQNSDGSIYDYTELINEILSENRKKSAYQLEIEHDLMFNKKYQQLWKYFFKITPDDMWEIGLEYETTTYIEGISIGTAPTHKYIMCSLGEAVFFAQVPYNFDISRNKSLTGIFVYYDEQTIIDIRNTLSVYESIDNFFIYEFNTITNFFWTRVGKFAWMIICITVLCLLLRMLIKQAKDKNERPLYRKILLLGGDVATVNEQLKDAQRYGRKYVTKDWVLTSGLIFSNITRNGIR